MSTHEYSSYESGAPRLRDGHAFYLVFCSADSTHEVLAGELCPGNVSVDGAGDLLEVIEYVATRLRYWNVRTHERRSMSSTRSTSASKRESNV